MIMTGYMFGFSVGELAYRTEGLSISYEVIKAELKEDAIEKSVWKEGDLARVVRLTASSNAKGTYSVFPEFERVDIGDLELEEEEK